LTARTPSRPLPQLALALAVALQLLACGPIGSTSVIGDAEVAVARAHASDGDKLAIYETTSADLYLQKAREESGHAHYDAASALAEKSKAMAETASQKATQARGAASAPLPRATITHEIDAPAPHSNPPVVAPVPAHPGAAPPSVAAPASAPAPSNIPPPLADPGAKRSPAVPAQPGAAAPATSPAGIAQPAPTAAPVIVPAPAGSKP